MKANKLFLVLSALGFGVGGLLIPKGSASVWSFLVGYQIFLLDIFIIRFLIDLSCVSACEDPSGKQSRGVGLPIFLGLVKFTALGGGLALALMVYKLPALYLVSGSFCALLLSCAAMIASKDGREKTFSPS